MQQQQQQSLHRQILHGNCLEKIKEIPNDSIDVVITSPPYWALRDYKATGQWGSESNYTDYLQRLITLTKELKRIIKQTGSIWINIGDTYVNKTKMLLPFRYAIKCTDELNLKIRNDAIWFKPNAMPQSAPDRLTNKFESLFFMVKNTDTILLWQHKTNKQWTTKLPKSCYDDPTKEGKTWRYSVSNNKESLYRGFTYYFDLDAIREKSITEIPTKRTKHKQDKTTQTTFGVPIKKHESKSHSKQPLASTGQIVQKYKDYERKRNPVGKNPGDILTINTKPLSVAHTAAYPVDLPLKIIMACCPTDGIVLDPFFGAGTTGVAAEILDRQWVGIELNKEYIDIANTRIKKYMGTQKSVVDEVA